MLDSSVEGLRAPEQASVASLEERDSELGRNMMERRCLQLVPDAASTVGRL